MEHVSQLSGSIMLTKGIAPFAQRLAAKYFQDWNVSFASASPIPQPLLDAGHYHLIPPADQPAFIHELLKLCLDQQISYLMPLDREEAAMLSGAKGLFSEYGIEVLASDPEILDSLSVMENPPRALELVILKNGTDLLGKNHLGVDLPGGTDGDAEPASDRDPTYNPHYSGVFCLNDEGEVYQCFAV